MVYGEGLQDLLVALKQCARLVRPLERPFGWIAFSDHCDGPHLYGGAV
jgi:hypothetical protein